MSTFTANPFSLLSDDASEDGDVPAAAAPPAKHHDANKAKGKANGPATGGKGPSGGRAAGANDAPASGARGGSGGNAGGRGRGGNGGSGNRPPKREFERHSGTGRGRETQKSGAGAHNWGDKDTAVEQTLADAGDDARDTSAVEEVTEGAEAPAAREEKAQTLQQFQKSKVDKSDALRLKTAVRKVEGPGAGIVPFKKEEEIIQVSLKDTPNSSAPKKSNDKKKEKTFLETKFFSAAPEREREGADGRSGGRGGRGGGRGGDRAGERAPGGGRGRGRGDNNNAALNLADQSAFPALG